MTSSTDAQSSFRPQQVICLEQGERRLYASVIQFIELQLCSTQSGNNLPEKMSIFLTDLVVQFLE